MELSVEVSVVANSVTSELFNPLGVDVSEVDEVAGNDDISEKSSSEVDISNEEGDVSWWLVVDKDPFMISLWLDDSLDKLVAVEWYSVDVWWFVIFVLDDCSKFSSTYESDADEVPSDWSKCIDVVSSFVEIEEWLEDNDMAVIVTLADESMLSKVEDWSKTVEEEVSI